jgi:hypothetical protein
MRSLASVVSISPEVSNARILLAFLICISPVAIFFDGTILHGVLAGIAAIGIAVVSTTMRPGETSFLISVIRSPAVLAGIPALWILIQVLPLRTLAHPIWTSAEAAIGHPLAGAISIDIGASVMALGKYLSIVAITLFAAAVAVDRRRAETILFSLWTATVVIALSALSIRLLSGSNLKASAAALTQASDSMAVGVTIAAAATVRAIERFETRHDSLNRSAVGLSRNLSLCVTALLFCTAALGFVAPVGPLVAAASGVGVLGSVILIRRLGLGRWSSATVALLAGVVAIYLVADEPGLSIKGPTMAFASEAPASLVAMSQRILNDTPSTGTGAGTFAAIATVYRESGDQTPQFTAPTAATALVIELGRPMSWFIATGLAIAILALLRASLRRGRDSFYAAAGAGALVTVLVLSFMNAETLGTGAAVVAATTYGLAIAQSRSRSVQQ